MLAFSSGRLLFGHSVIRIWTQMAGLSEALCTALGGVPAPLDLGRVAALLQGEGHCTAPAVLQAGEALHLCPLPSCRY